LNNYPEGVPGTIATELKQAKPMSLEAEALLNIHRTAGVLEAGMVELLKPYEISPAQYNVLRILRGAGKSGLACREIGDRMVTRDPDITRLLDRLERRALIERSRESRDRRVVTVRITGAGLRSLKRLDGTVDRFERNRFRDLGAERLQSLIEALELVRATDNTAGTGGER
jgi:DNA-binding MarR family transcriptional regulator